MSAHVTGSGAAHKSSLIGSIKRLASTLLEMGQTRLELLANDLEEERAWLAAMLLWTVAALFFAVLAVVLLTLLVIVYFWDSNRLLALLVLTGIFAGAAGYAWSVASKMSKGRPRLFAASIAELAKDREQLAPQHE